MCACERVRFSKACVKAKDVLIRLRLTRAKVKEKVKQYDKRKRDVIDRLRL